MTASSSVSSSSMSGRSSSGPRLAARIAGEPRLDVADGVVAEIAGEAAAEARQPRLRRRAEAAEERAQERERIAVVALDDAAAILDFHMRSRDADAHLRRQADERVAAEALAADDRFEQERVMLVRELQVQRERRVEIRERLEHQRDAVVALRRERAEFGSSAQSRWASLILAVLRNRVSASSARIAAIVAR